jgi:hypothetical protein
MSTGRFDRVILPFLPQGKKPSETENERGRGGPAKTVGLEALGGLESPVEARPKPDEPLTRGENRPSGSSVPADPGSLSVALDPEMLRTVLGDSWQDPEAVAAIEAEVRQALQQYEVEVATGVLGRGPLLVEGYPLGLWLSLDVLAVLLPVRR